MGLDIDPKLKSECEEALKDGDSLMNIGKLKEALPYYEKVMDKLTFKLKLQLRQKVLDCSYIHLHRFARQLFPIAKA
ncbi:uncharacterized protein LOC142615514 isoform X3 [Castanea sativa]|uniref:uncharacterized protein LOC142615514 isoform X3 n=1 Tax=Castanea sativa TaxID=21020 RepID=UPI003F6528A5